MVRRWVALTDIEREVVLGQQVEPARERRARLKHRQRGVRSRRVLAVHVPACAPPTFRTCTLCMAPYPTL